MSEADVILRGDYYEVDGVFDSLKDLGKKVLNKITGKNDTNANQAAVQQQQAQQEEQKRIEADEKKKRIKKIAIVAGVGIAGAGLLYLLIKNNNKQQ